VVGEMETAYYDRLWMDELRSRSSGVDNEAFWDGRAERFSASADQDHRAKRLNRVLDLLSQKGMLHENSSILDIGCGPGKFAVEMAKIGKEVIGIDVSSKMLAYAENKRLEEGLENLQFMKLDWGQVSLAELNWEKRFDLVFASMCPAINSQKALEKMISASRSCCYMSNFAFRQESIFDTLAAQLAPARSLKQQGNAVYCCFNILWLSGYYPEVTYMDSQWERKFSYTEALEYYGAALPIPGGPSREQSELMKKYLQQCSANGIILEKVRAKFAFIYWKI